MAEVTTLRLCIDLIPKPSYRKNLRTILSDNQWRHLHQQVSAAAGECCQVCGATGTLHCDEVWAFDDAASVQRLADLRALCPWCHHVKHFGHAQILANEGKLDLDAVVDHFMRVNACDEATFEAHLEAAMARWIQRSRREWKIDYGKYATLAATLPDTPPVKECRYCHAPIWWEQLPSGKNHAYEVIDGQPTRQSHFASCRPRPGTR
jgi:hypothetical protein